MPKLCGAKNNTMFKFYRDGEERDPSLCGRQVTEEVIMIIVTVTDILIVYIPCLSAAPQRKEMCPGE